MTHRTEQAESLLQQVITQVLQRDVSDPRIRGIISVTEVDVSPDLRQAKVKVTVLPEKYEKRTLAGLTAASRHIQSKVKDKVALRIVPHLTFEIDHGLKKQAAVFTDIEEGMRRTGRPEPTGGDTAPPAEPEGPGQ